MAEYRSQSPTKWDCKHPVMFILKRRKKVIYGIAFTSHGQDAGATFTTCAPERPDAICRRTAGIIP